MMIVGIAFAAMGVASLIRPEMVHAQFGASITSGEMRTEVRAVYGGFGIALAVLLFCVGATSSSYQEGVALSIAVALFGMAGGRSVGAVADRPKSFYPTFAYLVAELIGAIVLIIGVID